MLLLHRCFRLPCCDRMSSSFCFRSTIKAQSNVYCPWDSGTGLLEAHSKSYTRLYVWLNSTVVLPWLTVFVFVCTSWTSQSRLLYCLLLSGISRTFSAYGLNTNSIFLQPQDHFTYHFIGYRDITDYLSTSPNQRQRILFNILGWTPILSFRLVRECRFSHRSPKSCFRNTSMEIDG